MTNHELLIGEEQVIANLVETAPDILKAQLLSVQIVVHSMLRFINTKMTGTYLLDRQASAFLYRYGEARNNNSDIMMSDANTRGFLRETITGLGFWTCLSYGIDSVLGGLFARPEENGTNVQKNLMTSGIKMALKRRLRADTYSTEYKCSKVEEGLEIVHDIGFEIRPFGGF